MVEWSFTKFSTLRQCHRKFYFAYEISDYHFTYPYRRKAFELGQSKNIKMWQGSLIDYIFNKSIINSYKEKYRPDYKKISLDLVEIAKRQFAFSQRRAYHDKNMTKKLAGEEFLILDIHESGVLYNTAEINKVFTNIAEILNNLPKYPSPETGLTLDEYLLSSDFLIPNVQRWSYEFENTKLNPQIDLIRYKGDKIQVIDWKVSDSFSSDYSKQLYISGIVAFHNIKKKRLENKQRVPKLDDVSLFEFNLMNGRIKEHLFNVENAATTLDYIYLYRDEQDQLNHNRKWNELNIEDYEITDKKETCMFCKYKTLCIHLIKNNYIYDEQEYCKLVQNI